MSRLTTSTTHPPQQQAIVARCFHPRRSFTEFREKDVEQSIPARFEHIVHKYPDRLALKVYDQELTYAELNAMADHVARTLLTHLGGKAELVALLVKADVSRLAAMLGVLKAGKFFLLLDPSFPQARIRAMLEDSRSKWMVIDDDHTSFASKVIPGRCRLLQWQDLKGVAGSGDPSLDIAPKALAFINYTSGSTGAPKGLLQTHRVILHNIMLRTNTSHVCEHDRISLLSSGTANAITNTFLALLNGAALFPFDAKKTGVTRLAHWLTEEKITICAMGSPLFRSFCETLNGNEEFPNLRIIRLRSEAVYKTDVDLYKKYFSPNCIFVTGLSTNETGPLRDYFIDHASDISGNEVPLGYPVSGKEVLLLHEAGNEIGFNEIGEIAVRSDYVSPGYLRRPELTRAKFKPDPNGGKKRLYLTGDLGLMLPDGCLLYKGRKDFRVKIRGYGVDLIEVESALRTHSDVSQAVVMTRQNQSGEPDLVAYFTTLSKTVPRADALRTFLKEKLADHMIPSAFIKLDRLPLTPHNKVDRNALPDPGHLRPELHNPFVPPQTALEQELAKIWAEVLSLDTVGVHDNFFDLGGHSLAAARIISRVTKTFGQALPVEALFESPTVAAMASVIVGRQKVKRAHFPLAQAKADRSQIRPTRDFLDFKTEEIEQSVPPLSSATAGTAPIPGTEVSHLFKAIRNFSEEQRAIRARCVHPTGAFVGFTKEEIEQSIPQRFEKIVRLYPDRLAIKAKDRALSYGELNRAANHIAMEILAKQRDKQKPVGLLFEQGIEAIVAILGALKAGQFYVALDPSFPLGRIASVLEDSGAGLLLTNQQNIPMGTKLTHNRCQLLDIDTIDSYISDDDPSLSLGPETLACIMYTSGSSGEPKGVVHNQRNLLHWVRVHTNQLRICPSDRLTLLQSCSVASSVHNLFGALLNGASLFPLDLKLEAPRLARWLIDEQMTIYHSIPTVFRQMTDTLTGQEQFPDLRVIRLSGMAITREDVERYKKRFSPDCILVHVMGTTEAGTVPHYFIDKLTQVAGRTVPVGYAAEDAEIVLLDDNGQELGTGKTGEIGIKSRYLAPGYWRRPELTKSKFLADPDSGEHRIYLTGDLGRTAPDGCLFHLGRKDLQVKVRGYRIETREVEMKLLDHADIHDAAVIGWESQPGETQLVAYFVPTGDHAPSVSELRSFLQEKLPEYMIPSAFVPLHALPLTPNGKVDWKLLPSPGSARPKVDSPFVPPGKPVEKELARIWAELLGIDQVGIQDNFFDLGGHSLLAARVLSRVFHVYRVDVPLSCFFAAPTVAALAGYLERPCPPQETETQSIEPVSRDGPVPLSFAQQRLWFLDQLDPGNFAYNLFSAFQLKGQLNVKALEQSFNEIIRRHETLRTVFITVDRQPLQTILPSLTIQIPVVDLRHVIAVGERDSELRRLCTAEAQLPFDLRCGPLLRVTVVRLTEDESMLLLTRHHIVFDGWSAAVLLRELSALYAAFCRENPSPLPELPTQYRDFALWQRQWLQGKVLSTQLHYWKQQLDNLAILQLPTDRPRSTAQSSRGACQRFVLTKTLTQSLKTLSHRESVTPFMTLLAAFQTLLQRYTNQSDIAIGAPVAGRNRPEVESLIGFFLNMLVLRTDLSGNPTFRELVARVRAVCLSAYEHQDLPFETLVEELQPERNLGHNPLFQVTFALQNTPKSPLDLAGLTTATVPIDPGIARFDLHLFLEEDEETLKGHLNYNTELFNPETISRMVAHFQRLLEAIVDDPDQRIGELPLLTETERHQVLVEWNDTKKNYPKDKCIHQLFEEQAKLTPDAVAVVIEDQQLTYRELNERANQLAHYLGKVRMEPDTRVGICMERSLETIVALVGILKAGGAYVPLDPAYPKDRLGFMLADAKVRVVLTQEKFLGQIQHPTIVLLDKNSGEISYHSAENPRSEAALEDLAYVMYTSGSIGQPKGVEVTHRGVLRLLFGVDYARFDTAQTFLHLAPLSFDASTFEIWGALLHGAKCVLFPGTIPSAHELEALLHKYKITSLWLTASLFNTVIDEAPQALSGIAQLLIGGEALSVSHVRRALTLLPHTEIINGYGPTESTTFTCCYPIPRQLDDSASSIPIGRPIANTQVYVLDSNLAPVPVGVAGELYIGGDGLARGYLNRPELTAVKFIPNPFSTEAGARLYKTGDLARYRPDGNIEFFGRIDHQVKIRGFRIEPGEIEAVLCLHPAVREVVVLAREDSRGQRSLIAYVVSERELPPTTSELRNFLKQKVPDYMVPSNFAFLDSLPLTPNGKVNRSALPHVDQTRAELAESFVAPRTDLEASLAKIWSELLKLNTVGVHDNFFDLGGHSLLVTQMVSRVHQTFQVELPVRAIFETPTIAGLVERINQNQAHVVADLLADIESLSNEEAQELAVKETPG